jgi:hypothetical protein
VPEFVGKVDMQLDIEERRLSRDGDPVPEDVIWVLMAHAGLRWQNEAHNEAGDDEERGHAQEIRTDACREAIVDVIEHNSHRS